MKGKFGKISKSLKILRKWLLIRVNLNTSTFTFFCCFIWNTHLSIWIINTIAISTTFIKPGGKWKIKKLITVWTDKCLQVHVFSFFGVRGLLIHQKFLLCKCLIIRCYIFNQFNYILCFVIKYLWISKITSTIVTSILSWSAKESYMLSAVKCPEILLKHNGYVVNSYYFALNW